MSWLIVTGTVVRAVGNECARIIPRTTTRSAPPGTSVTAERLTASSVILSSASLIRSTFMSFGLTQGMEPVQYSLTDLLGVPPPTTDPSRRNDVHVHPSGKVPLSVVTDPRAVHE